MQNLGFEGGVDGIKCLSFPVICKRFVWEWSVGFVDGLIVIETVGT